MITSCTHWEPATGLCGVTPTHPYLTGPRCGQHAPAAQAGHTVPTPDSDRTLVALRRTAGLPDWPQHG